MISKVFTYENRRYQTFYALYCGLHPMTSILLSC